MELEAGCVVWSIRRLRRYLFGVYFLVFTDHQCPQQICKVGETKPRIQRWIEFLSAYNFRLSYRRGQENANADFLSRLPLPPIADDVSGASALTDPDDLGVLSHSRVRTHHPFLPRPWRGLGWAGPLAGYPRIGWAGSFTGYSGLGWATPDIRRLPDTPCPDTVSSCDYSPSSPSRDLSPGALHNLRY